MTEEEIIKLAEECGGENINGDLFYIVVENLFMFADYVAIKERKACALIAEKYLDKEFAHTAEIIADEIREREICKTL